MQKLSLATGLVLTALGLLAGCGDDDDSNGGTAGSANAGSAGTAGSTNGGSSGTAGSTNGGSGGSSGSTNGGSAGSVTAGSGGSAGSTATDLTGHWTTTSPDSPKVDITLSATSLEVLVGSDGLKVQSQPDGSFAIALKNSGLYKAKATPQKAGGGLGIVPLPLAGTWKLGTPTDEPGYGCTTSLVGADLSASCDEVDHLPEWLDPDRGAPGVDGTWSEAASPHFTSGSVKGKRTEERASSFGALSGRWSLTLSGGGSCAVVFENTTFTATCQDATDFTGKLEVTIDGDMASGSLSSGLEFMAMRN